MADDVPLVFEFTTNAAPVQAEGTIAGRRFYFRARHDAWSFAVADNSTVDPVDIDSPEDAVGRGWFRSGQMGLPREFKASYLSLPDAEALIRQCCAEYVAARDL